MFTQAEIDADDLYYSTLDDFLASRHKRYDDADHDLMPECIDFHFNKPGFDLAVIITHRTLIATVAEFQAPFHSKFGLTTHAIYLSDSSRLKHCIKDLKLHEILYAIVVSEESKRRDQYDLFILSEKIEVQKRKTYKDTVNFIIEDFENYKAQLKLLFSNPERFPHAKSDHIDGFIEPSDNIRYLLCLLFDHRMLKYDELLTLRRFIKQRKQAIQNIGLRPANYELNDRPVPNFRQEKSNYFVYDYSNKSPNISTVSRVKTNNNSIPTNSTKKLPSQPSNKGYIKPVIPRPAIGQPIVTKTTSSSTSQSQASSAQPNKFLKSATISAPPKLYNTPNAAASNSSIEKDLSNAQKPSLQSKKTVEISQTKSHAAPARAILSSNPQQSKNNQESSSLTSTPQANINKTNQNKQGKQNANQNAKKTSGQETATKRKIQFSVSPASKPAPITHSNVTKAATSNVKDLSITVMNSGRKVQAGKDNSPLSSPEHDIDYDMSSPDVEIISETEEGPSENGGKGDKSKDSLVSPAKKMKHSHEASSKPGQRAQYAIDVSNEQPIVFPKTFKVSCGVLVNLFKCIINLSPLALPPQNLVIQVLKKSLDDIEKFSSRVGIQRVSLDMRSCRVDGCKEIIKIIELLFDETVSSKQSVADLSFMWSHFPRNISENSVTMIFYKLMKMLELTKLITETNEILVNMLQNLQKVMYYNFQGEPCSFQGNYLDYFPSLFSEFFNQKDKLHELNLSLPAPEEMNVTFNTDIDKTIVENKIKFVVGPLMEYFIRMINSIHYQLDVSVLEVAFWAARTLRFCLRKICIRLLPEQLEENLVFSSPGNLMDKSLELIDEINNMIREVTLLNCLMFTKKHYDLINVILDFSIKIEKSVIGDFESDMDDDKESLVHVDFAHFVREFSSTVTTAVFPYDPRTEVDVLKNALKNRWIDTLQEAFKGTQPPPEGARISKEVALLLPKNWGRHAFEEAVETAGSLAYSDWDRLVAADLPRARQQYADVRNNYLLWLSHNGLDHRKAMEVMTVHQRALDAKILQLSS